MKELITIQSELKAPKSQFNKFGNYKYRKAEDILEAVKPILKKENCTLTITDDIVLIGSRIYVKATATLRNSNNDVETTTAFAREEESKKGMDGSQVTGAASSYARKYALNGLFAIDDNQDSDMTSDGRTTEQAMTKEQMLAEANNYLANATTKEQLTWIYNTYYQLRADKDFLSALTSKRKQLNL